MLKNFVFVLLLVFQAAGCFSRPDVDPETTKTASVKTVAKKKPVKAKPVIKRETMEGNWAVQFNRFEQQGYSQKYMTAAIIKVERQPDGKGFGVKILQTPIQNPKVFQKAVTDRKLELVLVSESATSPRQALDLEITFKDGQAVGTAALMGQIQPARLVATNDTTMANWGTSAEHEKIDQFRSAMQQYATLKKTEPLEKFIAGNPKSPLAYVAVLSLDPIRQPDAKPTVEQLKRFRKLQRETLSYWGARAYLTALAMHLGNTVGRGVAPEYNLAEIKALENEKQPFPLSKTYLANLEVMKQLASGDVAMTTNDPAKRAAAVKYLTGLLKGTNRYNVRQLYALMIAAEKSGRIQEAIDRLGLLVGLPSMQIELEAFLKSRKQDPPDLRKKLEQLWSKKHGSTKGLDEYLTQIYDRAVDGLGERMPAVAIKPGPKERRVVLLELFTDSDNPFCTAAELSLTAIRRAFPPDELIVLRYALDAKKPGPLVCSDSKNRAFDMQDVNPPRIRINGNRVEGIDGSMSRAPHVHRFLKNLAMFLPELDEKSPACQLALVAKRIGDKITITATGETDKDQSADLRLRIAIAEDHIDFKGGNGVRRHEMVVRAMPTGTDGIAFNDGKLSWKSDVDLKQVRRQLLDFLTSYEERLNIKLPLKPVDLKNIHVVAFIQNKRTQQILEATSVHLNDPANPAKTSPTSPAKKKSSP